MKRLSAHLLAATLALTAAAQEQPAAAAPSDSVRADGRAVGTYAIVHEMLKQTKPKYAYRPNMSRRQLRAWQRGVGRAMASLMRFPAPDRSQPAPVCVARQPREGYTLERWELYPQEGIAVPFLVLRPDGLTGPVPAVLCIPGSGRTKEGLAGEPGVAPEFTENYTDPRVCMALGMVREGYVAVAVDNPAAGETADRAEGVRGYDYDLVSRFLLEMGWSWLGYASWIDRQVLDWMKQQPDIRRDRIVVSGFSLGTEPMMVLGAMDSEIYAFVYNDFLCQTQERALVLNRPEGGRRPFPNSIRHLIPDYWRYFNFPDVAAALAPRHIIFTEGGMDRDFRLVRSAYADFGAEERAVFHHYPRYADPAQRVDLEALPEGLDRATFFRLANVDPPSHYFKHELVLPWLRRILR